MQVCGEWLQHCVRADFTGRRRSDLTKQELADRMHSHPCYKKKVPKDEDDAPAHDDYADENWCEGEGEEEEIEDYDHDDAEEEG